MTEEQTQTLLVNIFNEVKDIKQVVIENSKEIKNNAQMIMENRRMIEKNARMIGENKQSIEKNAKGIEGNIQMIQQISKEVKNNSTEIGEIWKELIKLRNCVTKIEVEHGEKLQALFDVFKLNAEKLQNHENKFEKTEKILNRHSDEIYYLKTKIES